MTDAHRLMKTTLLILVVSAAVLGTQAQDNDGGTSSNVTGNGTTPPSSAASKPLPWKFLASPMGVLDQGKWKVKFEAWNRCQDASSKYPHQSSKEPQPAHACSVPSKDIEALLTEVHAPGLTKQRSAYVVIHIVDYENSPDHWYVYRSAKGNWGDPKWDEHAFKGQRIYGSHSILFLFVHLNAKAVTLEAARAQVMEAIQSAKSKTDADRNDLHKVLAQVPEDPKQLENDLKAGSITLQERPGATPSALKSLKFCEEESGDQFKWVAGNGVPTSFANVHYESAVVRRTPANIANLKTILGLLFKANAKSTNCRPEDRTSGYLGGWLD